jgi:dipeptidyl aminopeptidase/acylaminoacyl peptidase
MSSHIAPYGSWKSPITADLITAQTINLIELVADGPDLYWVESHPAEGGRYAILHRTPQGEIVEATSPDFYARTTVHEYGGGIFTVADGVVYAARYQDQRLYRLRAGAAPEVLTPGDGYRYADPVVDKRRNRLICVREDHTGPGEAVNTLVSVPLEGGDNGSVLVEGNTFYGYARLSPDGDQLAYLTWSHPHMPWDGTELWLAEVRADGTLGKRKLVAGGGDVSIFQPQWSPAGILHFVSDSSGWWNLYRLVDDKVEALYPMEAEFGEPQWVFGMSKYCFAGEQRIVCAYTSGGLWYLAELDTARSELNAIQAPYTDIDNVVAGDGFVAFVGGSSHQPFSVVRMDLASGGFEHVKGAFEVTVDAGYFSTPWPIEFPTTGGKTAHGFYYPPHNKDFSAPDGDRPPLLVLSHGGPTSAAPSTLRYSIQYWTSRGFAVLDVNYGGSTGYGTEYRRRLNGNWGIVDVDDCSNGALHLVEQGLADTKRLAIRGGSAGGYTTLACLAFKDVFNAGASHFGLSELEFFAKDTHKFESRYLDTLVGPYPQEKELYQQRSPINYTRQFNCPLILFQGDEDKIVPPSQSEMMYEALREREIPVAYLLFKGEQHGFRRAENIKRSLEAELYFYSKVFKFDLAEDIEPVEIENL